MNPLKQQLEQTLISNVIKDKCANAESVIFNDSWCSQNRCIRFTTPYFRETFFDEKGVGGKWKTGDFVMYEVSIDGNNVVANCVADRHNMNYAELEKMDSIRNVLSLEGRDEVMASWNLTQEDRDNNKMFDAFDRLLNAEIPSFENDLKTKLEAEQSKELPKLREGEEIEVFSKRYERNREARKRCLEAHGTACTVCGMDFGKVFGPEFEGKIEVHHIVPISKIGKDYVVDPINDLIPVCPNCHMALHSKKDGVYTVEELKQLYRKERQ